MALVFNDQGGCAWVSSPDETPDRFYPTKDAALEAYEPDKERPATTDSGESIETREGGKWV